MDPRCRAATTAIAVLAGAVLLRAEPARSIQWVPVVAGGDAAPGLPEGRPLEDLALVAVDGSSVFFQGGTSYPSYSTGIYRREPGLDIELIAPFEAETTTLAGLLFDVDVGASGIVGNPSFFSVRRDVSQSACPDSLMDGDASFLIDPSGAATPIAAAGAPVPGRPGWIFAKGGTCCTDSSLAPAVNDQGDLAFVAWIQQGAACDTSEPSLVPQALFAANAAGDTIAIALPGDPAPGAGDGSVFLDIERPVELNDRGELAFMANLHLGPTGDTVNAIYRWSHASGLQLVELGGTGGDSLAWTFRLGAAGHVAFLRGLSLYTKDDGGGSSLIVSPGDPAPGMPPGVAFFAVHSPRYSSDFDFAVNGLGDVAFAAWSQPEPAGPFTVRTWGVWAPDATGALQLRLVEGQQAPFLDGLTIVEPEISVGLALSDQRALLVMAQLGALDGTKLPEFAYYLIDASGNVQLLLRDHQLLEFAPGDDRLARIYALFSDPSLRHFAFDAYSSNGKAIFRGVVPESGALSSPIVALASLGALCARRRRA